MIMEYIFWLFLIIIGLAFICAIGENMQLRSYQRKLQDIYNYYHSIFFPPYSHQTRVFKN